MQGKMPRKKIHAKKKVKKKNSCRRKVNCDFFRRSDFLSENLSFRNQQYYQGQYQPRPQEELWARGWENMNKEKSLSSY